MCLGREILRRRGECDDSQTRISEIVKGNRRITADTALRLSRYFGTTAKFWLGLQDDYGLEEEGAFKKDELESIRHFDADAG